MGNAVQLSMSGNVMVLQHECHPFEGIFSGCGASGFISGPVSQSRNLVVSSVFIFNVKSVNTCQLLCPQCYKTLLTSTIQYLPFSLSEG